MAGDANSPAAMEPEVYRGTVACPSTPVDGLSNYPYRISRINTLVTTEEPDHKGTIGLPEKLVDGVSEDHEKILAGPNTPIVSEPSDHGGTIGHPNTTANGITDYIEFMVDDDNESISTSSSISTLDLDAPDSFTALQDHNEQLLARLQHSQVNEEKLKERLGEFALRNDYLRQEVDNVKHHARLREESLHATIDRLRGEREELRKTMTNTVSIMGKYKETNTGLVKEMVVKNEKIARMKEQVILVRAERFYHVARTRRDRAKRPEGSRTRPKSMRIREDVVGSVKEEEEEGEGEEDIAG